MNIVKRDLSEFTSTEWADIVRLREEEFVLAQQCIYIDADTEDVSAMHICCYDNAELTGYLRVLMKSEKQYSIGRIVTKNNRRNQGIAKKIITAAVEHIATNTDVTISMSAQVYLTVFYRKLGFVETGKMYLEDGIPHIKMTYQMS